MYNALLLGGIRTQLDQINILPQEKLGDVEPSADRSTETLDPGLI